MCVVSVVVVVYSLFGWFCLVVCFFFLIFCSKNGEFTSRNSFCLETDHLKDARSTEQCAGKLSKANLGVEHRGENQDIQALFSIPFSCWCGLAFPSGEVAVHFEIDWGTRASWRNQGTCPSLKSFLKYLKRNVVLFKLSMLLFLRSLEKFHFPAQAGIRKQRD